MSAALQEILVAFGGNAALLVVLGFLARSLIQTLLTKDIKKFEADLQATATSQLERLRADLKAQGDVSIEQLKSRLQQATIEHQVRFTKLHETRAEVIAEMYERIIDAEQEGMQFVTVEGYDIGTDIQREAREKTQATMRELYLFIEKRQIYLPVAICASLKSHLANMSEHIYGVGAYGAVRPFTSEKQLEQHYVFVAAYKAFSQELPAARKVLEDEFRRMLDVERPPLPEGAA
jgi:hypothetical protein